MLRATWRGLETWYGRDASADWRASPRPYRESRSSFFNRAAGVKKVLSASGLRRIVVSPLVGRRVDRVRDIAVPASPTPKLRLAHIAQTAERTMTRLDAAAEGRLFVPAC